MWAQRRGSDVGGNKPISIIGSSAADAHPDTSTSIAGGFLSSIHENKNISTSTLSASPFEEEEEHEEAAEAQVHGAMINAPYTIQAD